MVDDLEDINKKLSNLINKGTSVISGVTVIKAVPTKAVIDILKSGGVLSAEEVLINNPKNLLAKMNAKENSMHPQTKNAIYASVYRTKGKLNTGNLNDIYGNSTVIIKNSVLSRPNTTYTYFDTMNDRLANEHIDFYKGSLLTESEVIKANNELYSNYIEVQIKSKVTLAEIEKIIINDRPPTTEEIELADRAGVVLEHKGAIVAGNLPKNYNALNNSGGDVLPLLPTPTVSSPINNPPQLPDFTDIPRLPSVPKNPTPINPRDPKPIAGIPMFTDFPSHEAVAEYLRSGRDIEVLYEIKYLAPYFRDAARDGNAGVYSKGIRYTHPFPDL